MSVVEKRYQACVMIVETYLDPLLHERAPPELYLPRFRQQFADACYDFLNDGRLTDFLTSVRSDDPVKIAEAGRRLSTTLQFHPNEFVSEVARVMETRADHVFRYSQKLPDLPDHSNLPATQYAAFYPGLELVDAHLEHAEATGELTRDEDLQFGEVLDLAFSRSHSLDAEAYRRRLPLTRIRSCRSAPSAGDTGIQLADLVAGLFGRVASQAVLSRAIPAYLVRLAEDWRPVLAPPDEHYLMLADAVLSRTVQAVFDIDVSRE